MTRGERIFLDPNRKHTEAEAELVMYVFDCDRTEAWEILNAKPSPEMRAMVQGMADSLRLEQQQRRQASTKGES